MVHAQKIVSREMSEGRPPVSGGKPKADTLALGSSSAPSRSAPVDDFASASPRPGTEWCPGPDSHIPDSHILYVVTKTGVKCGSQKLVTSNSINALWNFEEETPF